MHIYSIEEEVIGMDYPSTLPIPLFIMGISFLFIRFLFLPTFSGTQQRCKTRATCSKILHTGGLRFS
jgi:hypothetical protein